MKNKNLVIFISLILIFTAAVMSSCRIKGVIGDGDEKQNEYIESKNIYLGMSYVKTLNPVISKDKDTYMISKVIYDSLFKLDENMIPQPVLADSYNFSDDGTLNIKLRKDVKFHDGKDFDAYDAEYSINAYKQAGKKSLYKNHLNRIRAVYVDGKYKLSIAFSSKSDISLAYLTFPILPFNQYDSVSESQASKNEFKPVGTGPYAYKSYDSTGQLKLTPNKGYFGEVARNNLIFKVLPKKKYEYKLIESGALNVIFSELQDRYAKVTDPDVTKVNFPSREVEYIGFNCKSGAAAKAEIRKAVACAINAETIMEECYYNTCAPTDSLYYPGYMGAETDKNFFSENDSETAKYLSEAGYDDSDNDGILDKDGKKLKLRLLVNSDDECRVNAANMIKDILSNYRVKVSIVSLNKKSYKAALAKGGFDMYIGGYEFDETFDLRVLVGKKPTNRSRFSDAKLNKLLDKLRSGKDNNESKSIVSDIKALLSDELPYYPLFYKTYGAIQAKQMKGKTTPLFNDYLNGCRKWRCEFVKVEKEKPSD